VNNPTASEADLTPELIDRVMKLAPESKAKLCELLHNELDHLPDDRTDEEIAALIKQRSDEYHAGLVPSMTREESDAAIRAKIRELGFELP
jgi:putative addiction module component (TIGR02574 family)